MTKRSPKTDLETLLAAAYGQLQSLDSPTANARARRNFVFHMKECSPDIRELAELLGHPEQFDKAAAARLLAGALFHIIPHLRAAGRLLLDYSPEDIFEEVDKMSG